MGTLKEKYRYALVTGASSGLGLAFTQMLLDAGVKVIGLSRSPELKDAGEEYIPMALYLSDLEHLPAALDRIFQEFPEIDLVINNAGYGVLEYLEGQSVDQICAQYAVMLTAPSLIARRAITAFKIDQRPACLVNVSSLAVELPLPLMPIYNASKAGLSALSDSLILDASGADVSYTVLDFRPGDFNTNFAQRMEGRVSWNGVDLRAVMDRHHAVAPEVGMATDALKRALLNPKSGRVRVGEFFQAKVAPLGPRLLPSRWLQGLIRWYYRK